MDKKVFFGLQFVLCEDGSGVNYQSDEWFISVYPEAYILNGIEMRNGMYLTNKKTLASPLGFGDGEDDALRSYIKSCDEAVERIIESRKDAEEILKRLEGEEND